jgi:hypothetical protein
MTYRRILYRRRIKQNIENNFLNIINTPINGYSKIDGNFTRPLKNIIEIE